MDNFDNEVFEFGTNPNEETSNFNYEEINGLGESNYENEDLFENMPSVNQESTSQNIENTNNFNNGWNIGSYNYNLASDPNLGNTPTFEPLEEQKNVDDVNPTVETANASILDTPAEPTTDSTPNINNIPEIPSVESNIPEMSTIEPIQSTIPEMQVVETLPEIETNDDLKPINEIGEEENVLSSNELPTTDKAEEITESVEEPEPVIEMSETPIEDLQKLTEYEEEKIDSTDINSLFDRLSVNVKDASEIFRKNTNLKEKIDTRFEELKSLQNELTNSRKKQMEEIDRYRDEVLSKLTEKKEEIEKRLNVLKELQATLEKEKTEFEEYKRSEQANINKVQKEVQAAYDERREELEHIEEVLRKQKDSLDEERNQLSLDKIQYEADKNDLANNLLKFNQIVNSFTNGIEMNPEE